MKTLIIELKKEKRTGIILLMPTLGLLGGAYALLNFIVRKDTLLSLPLAPMTILLTQLYGMIMTLNLFGIIVAACMIYNIEFKGNAVKKMYVLPIHVPAMYLCKFLILTILLSVVFNVWVVRFSLTDFNGILQDNAKCSELIQALEQESTLFESYMRNPDTEKKEALERSMKRTKHAVYDLPFQYRRIGELRYAKTWSIRSNYEVYCTFKTEQCIT